MIRLQVKSDRRGISLPRAALTRAVLTSAEDLRDAAREMIRARERSGRLRESVFARPSADGLSAEVGTDLDYGTYLEFGTQRMAPRPWLHPAFESAKAGIKGRIFAAARDALLNRGKS